MVSKMEHRIHHLQVEQAALSYSGSILVLSISLVILAVRTSFIVIIFVCIIIRNKLCCVFLWRLFIIALQKYGGGTSIFSWSAIIKRKWHSWIFHGVVVELIVPNL